ncbi:hypothetical protein SLEP1_g59761, partial [Rubroshorea leprosula]
MVKGLPSVNQPDQLCEGCLLGKQSRKSFPKQSQSRAMRPLQLVHTDNFKALVEKESGFKIQALRSDRGGEFTSKEFQEFYAANGVRHFLTAPGSPQQNGVVERKNKTILNMARSMMKTKKMPREFWDEAVLKQKDTGFMIQKVAKPSSVEMWILMKKPCGIGNLKKRIMNFFRLLQKKMMKKKGKKSSLPQHHRLVVKFHPQKEAQVKGRCEQGGSVIYIEKLKKLKKLMMLHYFVFLQTLSLNFNEAAKDEKWRKAMDEEMNVIKKNDTWELVTLPQGHAAIGVKWVFKEKKNSKGEVERYKARLVAKGYKQ